MGKRVLVVKNISHEGPGSIEGLLRDYQIACDMVEVGQGEPFPSPGSHDAVLVLGGPDSANDETEKMRQELRRIREILDAEIPYLGICLGLQLLVKAGGGRVVRNRVKEIGFRDPDGKLFQVDLTAGGKGDPLFSGFESHFPIFHLHGETVILTEKMSLLGKGKWCVNQGVRVGKNAYGLQGHLELTREMLEIWMDKDPDLLRCPKEGLRRDFDLLQGEYLQAGQRLFTNFLKIMNLFPRRVTVR